jgi:hypothetical protein
VHPGCPLRTGRGAEGGVVGAGVARARTEGCPRASASVHARSLSGHSLSATRRRPMCDGQRPAPTRGPPDGAADCQSAPRRAPLSHSVAVRSLAHSESVSAVAAGPAAAAQPGACAPRVPLSGSLSPGEVAAALQRSSESK